MLVTNYEIQFQQRHRSYLLSRTESLGCSWPGFHATASRVWEDASRKLGVIYIRFYAIALSTSTSPINPKTEVSPPWQIKFNRRLISQNRQDACWKLWNTVSTATSIITYQAREEFLPVPDLMSHRLASGTKEDSNQKFEDIYTILREGTHPSIIIPP